MNGHPAQSTTASVSPERCSHCAVTTETLGWETTVATILCEAARDELFFKDRGASCLAMIVFARKERTPPASAAQLLARMKELREPLS